MKQLRHKPSGNIYRWNAQLASMADMELFDAPATTPPPERKAKGRASRAKKHKKALEAPISDSVDIEFEIGS